MSSSTSKWWVDDLTDVCVQFQLDLSCLVDGELEEYAAGRAIAHLEECSVCREFFDEVRMQVRAHMDLSDPDALLERYSTLTGAEAAQLEGDDLVGKLATIFYQLGKAYVLSALDPGFKVRIFEKAVAVTSLKANGRGFVDGVLESGRDGLGGLDWTAARHILNGKLEKIESPVEKGRRLLNESLGAQPGHEEARLYLAWLDAQQGKPVRAAKAYRQIFNTAAKASNRAHAVAQLGSLYAAEEEYKKAIACCRWITMSGLADSDERFFYVRFNIGMYYADMQDQKRSLSSFRELLDRHPERASDIAQLFLRSPRTRAAIDLQPGFPEALLSTCPELFRVAAEETDSGSEFEEDEQ